MKLNNSKQFNCAFSTTRVTPLTNLGSRVNQGGCKKYSITGKLMLSIKTPRHTGVGRYPVVRNARRYWFLLDSGLRRNDE